MWNEIKDDKLKSIVVVLSIIIFIVGVVVTAVNAGNSYASDLLTKYECKDTGYPHLHTTANNGSFCCDSLYNTLPSEGHCVAAEIVNACYNCNGLYEWLFGAYASVGCETAYSYTTEETCTANNRVTVTYDANGGRFLDAFLGGYEYCDSNTVCKDVSRPIYGKPYIVWYYDEQELAREGHTFAGWFDQDGNHWPSGEIQWNKIENITLYAKWLEDNNESKTYTVYFYNENTKFDEKSCTKKSDESHCTVYVPSGPSKDGHKFIGWSKDCNNLNNSKFMSGFYVNDGNANAKYYACFEEEKSSDSGNDTPIPTPTTYTINYDANGGSGAPGEQSKEQGKGLTLSTTKPTRADYTFVSWNDKQDGTGNSYAPGASYSDDKAVTLYAQWKKTETTNKPNDNTENVEDKTEQEIDTNNNTGDALIYTVWVVGVGTLAYSIYYFMKRRNSL